MAAMSDSTTDWQDEAVRLRRDQKMATIEIAERFGKSASQVRRVIAQAQTERAINGSNEDMEHLRTHSESGPINTTPAQGDIEQALAKPEDPLHAFKAEAGESVGDMPPVTPPEAEGYDVRLKGTRQMALDFGPESEMPMGATIKFKSDKLASGFYGLGDVITGTFTARIVDVTGAERFQRASEEFRIQPQGHVALITELAVDADG